MFEGLFKKQVKKLDLTDYKNIWTKFCFLDESGTINDFKNPFFTIGFIKTSQPYYLNSKIIYERQKRNFYDEMKFNKLSKNNIDFAKFVLDALFSTRSLQFHSYSLDKDGEYFKKEFNGDPWKAYEDISIRVLKSALPADEILIVIADYVTTPKDIKFEINVKRRINDELKRLAIAGVCRFDSKSNDLLQLSDLIIGAINYDLKLASGVILNGDKYKKRFLEYFKENLGIKDKNFLEGFRNYMFNIFVDKDVKKRLPLEYKNEKGPSS
jgi:hypothetical protein